MLPDAAWMLVSATRGDNLAEIRAMLVAALPESPALLYPEDEVTQTHLRDLAGELIREAALHALEQEVPHGIAVDVIDYDESQPDEVRISAEVIVERDTHKAIVIGKGGTMLQRIGTQARREIEDLLAHVGTGDDDVGRSTCQGRARLARQRAAGASAGVQAGGVMTELDFPFSKRYGSDEMRAVWSDDHKRRLWRRIWVALARAQTKAGLVTPEQAQDLADHADVLNTARALEIEAEIGHDV
ncbi:MAG TPA: KH domain-containing protein, partial [Anaerolineales bacterium]|nr:KH domain-containing protein [Anaerolineales bacterium]